MTAAEQQTNFTATLASAAATASLAA